MVWTAPKRFLPEDTLTSHELNIFLRDNLKETGPAKATRPGGWLVTSGLNKVDWRYPGYSESIPGVTTSSSTPVQLGSLPSVTVEHGGAFIVLFAAGMRKETGTDPMHCAPFLVGQDPPTSTPQIRAITHATAGFVRYGGFMFYYGLPAGTSTVRLRHWTDAGTGYWADRVITVLPL